LFLLIIFIICKFDLKEEGEISKGHHEDGNNWLNNIGEHFQEEIGEVIC
jgi:hypothetical protein